MLSGHIHRHQILHRDLRGAPLAAPVLYPGSIERTAFAERAEVKGFVELELVGGPGGGRLGRWRFNPLPARPMIVHAVGATHSADAVQAELEAAFARMAEDAVVLLRFDAEPPQELMPALSAARVRALAGPGRNVTVAVPSGRRRYSRRR